MTNIVNELASANKLADQDFLAARTKVLEALRMSFGNVDSGVGMGQADFWIQFEDIEYKLVMAPVRTLRTTS